MSRFVTRKSVITVSIVALALALGAKMEADWCKSIHEDTVIEFIQGTISSALPVMAAQVLGVICSFAYGIIQKISAKIEAHIKH
jgi:hypothetical protein